MPSVDLDKAFTDVVVTPEWIVEGVIPKASLVLIAGDAGVGKTVLNLTEAMHVALGRSLFGFKTIPTRVLYFDQENSGDDLLAYLQQIWIGMGRPDVARLKTMFRVEAFSLGIQDWDRKVREIAGGWQPGLLYIDTASSAFAVQAENENSEAQAITRKLRRLMYELQGRPSIKVLKHAKFVSGGMQSHGTRRTIRGAKDWLGAVDQVTYHIKATSGRPRKDGLHSTVLVPDKSRAFGLKQCIRVSPEYTETSPKGLILKGETFTPERDLLIVSE